ncbi:MscL family protein [Mycoplasmopsis ciconiae]|uniref:MscL family protein n=1 Tax=Mycoplasmopsis ciconiae TaxID=561067 RepID=A0ABU7MKC8_9BACT|nr:MscL family protein [Mycoplasmopsis ciconiae]
MFKKSVSQAKGFFKKGNILMLAIGLLLGTVFSALVASLANDVIMPIIFKQLSLGDVDKTQSPSGAFWGKFFGALINFLIVSAVLFVFLVTYFVVINAIEHQRNKNKPAQEPAPAKPTTEELILEQLKLMNENLKK